MSGLRFLAITPHAFGGRGGIARYNRDLLEALALHPACQSVVHLPRLAPDFEEPVPASIQEVLGSSKKTRYAFRVLRTLLRRRPVDLVVCAHLNLLPLAVLARGLVRAPLCLVLYGIDAWSPGSRAQSLLIRRVDRFVAISRCTAERFTAWSGTPPERMSLLYNAIRREQYGLAPRDPHLVARHRLEGARVLLTLGRLAADERYKGIDEVLEVLPALPDDVRYVVAGDGDDRGRLEAKAAQLGVLDRVRFVGFVTEAEKPAYYRLADAFVMPGRGEGFGFVYLEAMACGVPVVASVLDGSREAVRDGVLGELVDPRDPGSLRAGIEAALARPRGVPVGLDHFDFERFVDRCHAIVDDTLGAGAR